MTLRLARLARLAGFEIPRRQAARRLPGLGTEVAEHEGALEGTVPPARREVEREVDLVEEVLRTYGYDRVQLNASLPIRVAPPPLAVPRFAVTNS